MITPNKAITFEESLLAKLPMILETLSKEPLAVKKFYRNVREEFKNVNQFLLVMDTLFILEKVELIEGEIRIC